MIGRFRRREAPDTISALYGAIVAQARSPSFYRDYDVPDTIDGRFDLIVLHLVLVLERLRRNTAQPAPGQALFDRFCADMDHNLREMGVGDLRVPKEMRRIGEAFYGRAQAYKAALVIQDDAGLVETVIRNIYGGMASQAAFARLLAAYIREVEGALRDQDDAVLAAGVVQWPAINSSNFPETSSSPAIRG